MKKVKFGKEETKNLLAMLSSSDTENASIAFQAIENADLSNYIGELIVLYKYGQADADTWQAQAPKAWKKILPHFGDKTSMSSGKCLSVMTELKSSKESLELYFENFTIRMMSFLEQLGYPAERFNLNIELKDESPRNTK